MYDKIHYKKKKKKNNSVHNKTTFKYKKKEIHEKSEDEWKHLDKLEQPTLKWTS